MSRFFALGLVGVLLVGCGSAPPLIDIDQAATQTAEAVLGAPKTLAYTGASLTGLESYQAELYLSFEGQIGGAPRSGMLHMTARVDLTRPAATSRIAAEGDPDVFGEAFASFGTKTYIKGDDYITSIAPGGEEICVRQKTDRFDPLVYNLLSPDVFLPPEGVPPLTFVGPDLPLLGESEPTWRYRAEDFSTMTLTEATLEVRLAHRGEHVVMLDLRGQGAFPGQVNAAGAVVLRYTLGALNQPVEIALPRVCEPTPTPPPSPTPEASLTPTPEPTPVG